MTKLKEQAVNGILWTTVRTIITTLTGPLLLLFQARYLTPSEFGVLSVINIFLSMANVIENFGVSTAVIQRDKITKNEKSSLFFFQTVFSTSIGLFSIVVAPLTASFFNMRVLASLIPLLSIIIFLNGPVILFSAFLEKEFHFKELSIINISRQIVLFVSTAFFLVIGLNLRGVVFGQILSVIVMVILILIVSYRQNYIHLKFHFSIAEIKPFIKFGFSILIKQLMTQLTHHIDELIIGYFLSAEILGLYFFAKNLLNRVRALVATAFSKVLLPLLSKVKNDILRLTRTYNSISKYVGVLAFPLFIGIALTANQFVPIFFGTEWIDSVSFIIVLSIAYIPYLLTANIATSLLYSVNKPNQVLSVDIIANTVYIGLLFLFSWFGFGIYSVVILYAIYLVGKTTALQFVSQKYLHSSFKDYLLLFKNSVIATFFMSIVVLITKDLITNMDNMLVQLVVSIAVGITSYILSYYLIDKETLRSMKNLILNK